MKPRVDTQRSLRGQVAVVTGAAGAIGAGIARTFVDAGAMVVLGDVRHNEVGEVAATLGDDSVAVACECDVSRPDQVENLMQTAVECFGQLDVLANVAGITHTDDVLEVSIETWRKVFSVNVDGVLMASQQAAKIMLSQEVRPDTERRGAIVNVSSQGAEFPIPSSTAYGASKTALNYLSKTLAVALSQSAISTTVVYPGMVYEGMWRQVNLDRTEAEGGDFEVVMREHLAETPTGRFQEPEDLAQIVLYAAEMPGMWLNGRIVWSEAHPEW